MELMFHHCPPLQPFASGVATIYKDFRTYKSLVPVCGCILLNPEMTKCILVQGYGSGTWGFPRGKINKDEPMSSCALREVYEETGYDASSNLLLDEFIDFKNRKQAVRLYLCPNVPSDTRFETRTRKEIKKISWFRIEQLPMSFESKKQPGTKFFSVPPVVVSHLRSWIKKHKGGKKSTKKKKKGKQQSGGGGGGEAKGRPAGMSDPSFPTDSEISGRELSERTLVPWEPSDDEDSDNSEYQLKLSGKGQVWNQWAANHEKFGYVSDYNPEDYTTKLDESNAVYAERLLQSYGVRKVKKKANHNASLPPSAVVASVPKKLLQREQPKETSLVKSKAMNAFDEL